MSQPISATRFSDVWVIAPEDLSDFAERYRAGEFKEGKKINREAQRKNADRNHRTAL
jgi:hypothetical protein